MFSSLKKIFKCELVKISPNKKSQTPLLLAALLCILEDAMIWKNVWLSLSFIFLSNLTFFVCIHCQVNFVQFTLAMLITIISIDAFEAWLRYKHRHGCLKRLVAHESTELKSAVFKVKNKAQNMLSDYIHLREINHTKAFLLGNFFLAITFLVGKYISGYFLMYLSIMFLCFVHKIAPAMKRFLKKIEQNAESDGELEGLIPEVSELDIKLLSIEPELQTPDEKQSLDYWKPVDSVLDDASDSSDNSSSLITNISMEKVPCLEKEVDSSDSSEDEYIPRQHKDHLQSTLEVVNPAGTWSSSAYDALVNFSGVVANLMVTKPENTKRKRIPSIDSSDGFEMVDKNDLN